jgi:hypothetical protein
MIANATLFAIAVLLAYGLWLMDQLKFLVPYRTLLFQEHGTAILLSLLALFANVFAGALLVQRKFLLKDTGRKLFHVDQQFRVGQAELPKSLESDGAE